MKRAEKARIREQNGLALAAINARRVAAGVCRHCGGKVPCWSEFGDTEVGKRHTRQTFAAMQARS